jgi:glutathione synthase/RimK-type ligase-like ATP-grasp enzyme
MSGGRVVLVGSAEDEHVRALHDSLAALGALPVVLDSLRFPERTRIALGAGPEDIRIDGAPLGRPRSVYLRSTYTSALSFGVDVSREMEEDWRTTLVTFREKAEMLISILQRWEEDGVPIYNRLGASERTRKPYQLALLARAGLPIPDTLWTNDPDAVRTFARRHGRIAYKPVAGGAATQELLEHDLDERRLAALANAPVTFQELLPGEDRRVFVVDGAIVAAHRITTAALDYRQREDQVEPVALDPDTEALCLRAAATLDLRFSGIDLKRAADGTWRLLELNPSPMFLGFDTRSGTDVLGRLARALAAPP